jgi:hypothetical protein
MCEALSKLGGIELVFIDDDPLEERFDTIRKVLQRATRWVVVHDAERESVHHVLDDWWPFACDSTTAVFWNPAGMRRRWR